MLLQAATALAFRNWIQMSLEPARMPTLKNKLLQ
jgi:hypothetical protein